MENKLSVRDLTISFRTTNGKVQAVRGISFDLAKGETLSIVGESGSGKSVTSKAILGILAGNAIIEGGEIIYDGRDLLKISEDEFHKIRGDKIAMIFQDPMSSLNPIVKIGKQLTEAMILKGKARQKESRTTFNSCLKLLNQEMIEAIAANDQAKAEELTRKCQDFNKFEICHIKHESIYNDRRDAALEAVDLIEELTFEMGKNSVKDASYRIKHAAKLADMSVGEYVVDDEAGRLGEITKSLVSLASDAGKPGYDFGNAISLLGELHEILARATAKEQPNFFAMGYYLTFGTAKENGETTGGGAALPKMPIDELNRFMRKELDDGFMLAFIEDAKKGIMHSAERAYANREKALSVLRDKRAVFTEEKLDHEKCVAAHKEMADAVAASIDHLAIVKDSLSYTFSSGLKSELDVYFHAHTHNKAEQAKHDRMQAKYDALKAKGKEPDWKVPAASITNTEMVKENILHQIDRLIAHLEEIQAAKDKRNYDEETVALIDFMKANASGVVRKVTKSVAKQKAIKLMEEVGIAEPRKRYNQYPFEFSGGMRQRIVIAIALAADPDILICDEPTTALDVTIQAQILELINKLKEERHLSVIFITHDLGVVANMADRIAVMYAGKIVEYGTSEDVFYHAAHPYTWALLSSMPDLDTNEKLEAIPGTPPNMIYPPVGDAFAARNKYAMKIDFERQPPMFRISDTHSAATWLLHPDAPKVEPPKAITDRIARMMAKRGDSDDE